MSTTTPITYDAPAPEWLRVGAEVAVIRSGGWSARAHRIEVAKLLKRDIVLANGQRFRHGSQQVAPATGEVHYEGKDAFGRWCTLCAVDSERVAALARTHEAERLRSQVRSAAGELCNHVTRPNIEAMEAAIATWRAANPEREA